MTFWINSKKFKITCNRENRENKKNKEGIILLILADGDLVNLNKENKKE